MILSDFIARCFLCGSTSGVFDFSRRICDCVLSLGFPADELGCYVTILPEPKQHTLNALPSVWDGAVHDVFAVGGPLPRPAVEPTPSTQRIAYLPYPTDLLATRYQLRCGNSVIQRSQLLQDLTGRHEVFVMNMGAYYWSGTLKDPRSWAILNTAISHGITDLAVWTAGNAGLSLAKLAYSLNRWLPPSQRIQVYAIVDNEVAPEIRTRLCVWQCEVLDVFRKDQPVLRPNEIEGLVAARLRRSRRTLFPERYWHVTNGWDGVGLLMYRALAAQVVRGFTVNAGAQQLPLHIVVPVGTGDLFLGFYLGVQDCIAEGLLNPRSVNLIGALPDGNNILTNVRFRTMRSQRGPAARPTATPPVMPKLAGAYSPLAPCFTRLDAERGIYFIGVSEQDQLRAGRYFLTAGSDEGLPCEPSALAAFAALPHLNDFLDESAPERRTRSYPTSGRVLIVNSGFGVLGHSEEAFLQRAIGG